MHLRLGVRILDTDAVLSSRIRIGYESLRLLGLAPFSFSCDSGSLAGPMMYNGI